MQRKSQFQSILDAVRTALYAVHSVIVENLVCVLQNGIDDLDLPACVRNGSAGVSAHEGRSEDDCQVVRVHAIDMRVIHNTVEMESEGAKSGVVGVGKAVDDSMEGVTADNVVVMFCWWRLDGVRWQAIVGVRTSCSNEAIVVLIGEERIRKITEKLLQQARNTVHIVIEVLWVPKVKSRV